MNVISISLPPLRDRKEDIPILVNHFIRKITSERDTEVKGISSEALNMLEGYDWPGNVRKLENVLLTTIISIHEPIIEPHHLPEYIRVPKQKKPQALKELDPRIRECRVLETDAPRGDEDQTLREKVVSELSFPVSRTDFLDDMERRLILRTLKESGENVSEAARKLQTPYSTLQRRISELKI